jgi:hypothetical protein
MFSLQSLCRESTFLLSEGSLLTIMIAYMRPNNRMNVCSNRKSAPSKTNVSIMARAQAVPTTTPL